MIHFHFRSTVRPQHDDDVIGSGPVDVWADDGDEARKLATEFERETFGMPRARVDLDLYRVDTTVADSMTDDAFQQSVAR